MFHHYGNTVLAASLAAAALCLMAAAWWRREPSSRWLTGAATVFLLIPVTMLVLVLFPGLVDSRYRTFRSLYSSIQTGMPTEAILAQLRQHYPQNGPRLAPRISASPSSLDFLMNPEGQPEPNSETFSVSFAEGKVFSKSYSAD
jgi:hypothetical protein